jgi:hypothetical protein
MGDRRATEILKNFFSNNELEQRRAPLGESAVRAWLHRD